MLDPELDPDKYDDPELKMLAVQIGNLVAVDRAKENVADWRAATQLANEPGAGRAIGAASLRVTAADIIHYTKPNLSTSQQTTL